MCLAWSHNALSEAQVLKFSEVRLIHGWGGMLMAESSGKSRKLLERLHELMLDESSLHFSDFVQVADAFIDGYSKFVRRGVAAPAVGVAMLGATVNLYEMFGMTSDLPDLLRVIADEIEMDRSLH